MMGENFVFVALLFGIALACSSFYCWFVLESKKVHVPVFIVVVCLNAILGDTACDLIHQDYLTAHPETVVPETPIDRPSRDLTHPVETVGNKNESH